MTDPASNMGPQSTKDSAAETGVSGERGTAVVNSIRSLQSRVSNFLAAGLMIALGLGALSWYYCNALSRQSRIRQAAATTAVNSAQGEMALPPLGAVERLPLPAPANVASVPGVPAALDQVAAGPPSVTGPDWNATSGSPSSYASPVPPYSGSLPPYSGAGAYRAPQGQGASDRRLSGVAFARESGQPPPEPVPAANDTDSGAAAIPANRVFPTQTAASIRADEGDTRGEEALTRLLRPRVTAAARAQIVPTQQFLLPKGAFVDCTLETAIDSTLPGMTTCVTATDTFGVDGKVVLLERGSKLVGETRGEVQNGSARVFVLWTEARTPTGVVVPLESPGTDELGRSGLPGEVNRHFWDRFGAAMLISVIDGAMQAAVQSSSRGGGAIIYNPASSQEALTDVLKGTINIAPTISKHQGDRIQILVARDIDFRTVYELRTAAF